MAGRNKLTGTPWHEEWHSVNPKKEKAADCIYLDEHRICSNKNSIHYLEKCFVASHCKYREREKKTTESLATNKVYLTKKIIRIGCSLPDRCEVISKAFGQGVFYIHSFNREKRTIEILFQNDVRKKFQYPEAFLSGHLQVDDQIYRLILLDNQNAIRE